MDLCVLKKSSTAHATSRPFMVEVVFEFGVVLGDHPAKHQGQLQVGLAEPVRGVRGPEVLE
eukprot:13778195-Alexandrium_andersonii.AAC.1